MRSASRATRRVYGDPVDFKSLSRAPVNELGVVYLFGVMHDFFRDLRVESIQSGFPDCIARRAVGKGRWVELKIEFEFESKAFLAHGHDPAAVDVIVCWEHNWPGCPENVEVIELSSLLRTAKGLSRDGRGKTRKLSDWQLFASEHRLVGRSFAEISRLWKQRGAESERAG